MNNSKSKRNGNGPEFIRFFKPVIEVLKSLGGSGSAAEVIDLVVERMNISDEELAVLNKNGGSRIKNQVNWAKMYLVNQGSIDNAKRGIWTLTPTGNDLEIRTNEDALRILKQVQIILKQKAGEHPASDGAMEGQSEIEQSEAQKESHRDQLITLLRNLSPNGFERICQRLLRESGFKRVTVTGKTGDGGIDGEGILEINPLITFKVLFQCKKYTDGNVIGSSVVRDFRGAMQGRADKGIILTTSTFTKEAKKEAIRDGVPPIELVDAESLIDLFESRELGLKPVTIYEIDNDFFKEFLDATN